MDTQPPACTWEVRGCHNREQQSNLTSVLPSNSFKGHIVYYIEDGVPQAQDARHMALVSSLLES